jgi:phage terminase large subunit
VTFDFKNPDYTPVFRQRLDLLAKLRADPGLLASFRLYYAHNIADFINDWGVTFDPRNIERGLPALMPFVLFPRQRECIEFILEQWRAGEPGLIEKSRDVGLSWIVIALGCSLCIFNRGFVVGYGSRKEEYVDKLDSPKSLFYKARLFLRYLPPEFRAGWNEKKHAPHMRIMFPGTESTMTGEAGDGIGRGDRTSLYMVDEAAHLERPMLVEASLSATTNCRIDLSSVNGMDNVFAIKRWGGRIKVFIFDWRDDPRKDDAWHAKQIAEAVSPAIVAQEVDRDYSASKEGIVIPSEWVQAAVGAAAKLGIATTGAKRAALDVADEGIDKNAWGGRTGVEMDALDEWSGKGSDIFGTVARAFMLSDGYDITEFDYDADGLGAGVRGDARVLNTARLADGRGQIDASPFRGSGAVVDPDRPIPSATPSGNDKKERTNKDFFANAKAQAWWALRVKFQITFRAVQAHAAGEAHALDPDEIISLSPALPYLARLTNELSQPTWSLNGAGKMVIDKAPDGMPSPNLADCVMMLYSPRPKRRAGFLSG